MNLVNSTLILLTAFVAVFLEASFNSVRQLLGAQIGLLPPLIVYASLSTDLVTLALLAVLGGLWFDSLSANPLGVSMLPLLLIGLTIYQQRALILREQIFAQLILGLGASAAAPALTLVLLLSMGESPLLGWGSLWQWIVMSLGGAMLTPVCFHLFGVFNRALSAGEIGQLANRLTGKPASLKGCVVALEEWESGAQGKSVPNAANPSLAARPVGQIAPSIGSANPGLANWAGGYLELPHDKTLDCLAGITLSAWILPSQFPPAGMRLLDKSPVGEATGYLLDTYPGNSLRLITRDPHLIFDANLPTNQWSHVAATVDGKTGRQVLFLNGKPVAASD